MHANARVLLFSDPTDTGDLAGKLEQRGYQPLPATTREDAVRIVTGRYPDIAIVNTAASEEGALFRRDLHELRPDGQLPTIVIGGETGVVEDKLQVEHLPAAFRDSELFSRLKVLSRLVSMQGELSLRSETSQLYGLEAPVQTTLPEEISDANNLVIAEEEDRRASILKMIAPIATADVVQKPYEGMERLLQDPFDVVIAVGGNDDDLMDFCRRMRNHANLFNMPLLVLCPQGEAEAQDDIYEAGASEVLKLTASAVLLLPRLHHLVRQQRYRQSMLEVYREGRRYAATDSLTGLFGHGYLHAHLKKQIVECRSRNKDLALGFFDIADMTGFNDEYGYVAGDRLLRQIGGAIGGFVRAEDLPARYNGDKFCIVLPDSDLVSASPVLQRIAGVINMTEFAITDVGEPTKIRLQTGCAMPKDDDGAESLIARARTDCKGG